MSKLFGFYGRLSIGEKHEGQNRVLRGGSWINNAQNLRSANRNNNTHDNRNRNTSFRLAGALSKQPKIVHWINQLHHQFHQRFNFERVDGQIACKRKAGGA